MIYFTKGTDLFLFPKLAKSMFSDRKTQFSDRLGWPVKIEQEVLERDQYDHLNPVYVIVQSPDGMHAGSMRLMPTMGRTMINEHFLDALGGRKINDENTWECTRFCVSQGQSRQTAIALFAAAGYFMKELGVENLVGIFDETIARVYHIHGVSPKVIGKTGAYSEKILAGIWRFDNELLCELTRKSGYASDIFELGIVNSSIFRSQQISAA